MLNASTKVILILPLILQIVNLVQGSAVRTVLYHDGVIEEDDVSSSSFEDIPPRQEWFRVRGNRPKSIQQDTQDIIALPSTGNATGVRSTPSVRDPSSKERGNGRHVQVNVRNHGRNGFQNVRAVTDDEQDESSERKFTSRFSGDRSDLSKLPSMPRSNPKNWYQRIRHENGHAKSGGFSDQDVTRNTDKQQPSEPEDSSDPPDNKYYEDEDDAMRTSPIESEQVEAVPIRQSLGSKRRILPTNPVEGPNYIDTSDEYLADSPPPHEQVAKMARYIVRNSNWTSVATISTMSPVRGYPFVNVFSVSDGPINNSTGVPYMYLTPLDMSVHDLKNDSRASLTMSLAQSDYCKQQQYDPEDPRCAHVILSGNILRVTNADEIQFARNAMYSKHPDMEDWPKDHGWFFAKLEMEHIVVLDYFGGAKTVSLDDYFKQSVL